MSTGYTYSIVFPTGPDVQAVALYMAQRCSDLSSTNGGIGASGVPAVPQVGVDAYGAGVAYLQAIVDTMMCARGFQGIYNMTLGVSSTSSGTYSDVPGAPFTFNAPIGKWYEAECDFIPFFASGSPATGNFRIVINGSAGADYVLQARDTDFRNCRLFHAAYCNAGPNTISLQWKVSGGTFSTTSSGSLANFIVRG